MQPHRHHCCCYCCFWRKHRQSPRRSARLLLLLPDAPVLFQKSFDQLEKELLLVQSFQTCLGFRAPVRVSLTFRVLKNLRDKSFFHPFFLFGIFFTIFSSSGIFLFLIFFWWRPGQLNPNHSQYFLTLSVHRQGLWINK